MGRNKNLNLYTEKKKQLCSDKVNYHLARKTAKQLMELCDHGEDRQDLAFTVK